MAQITNESDKVYASIRGLWRFTAGSVRLHKPSPFIEAMSLAAEFEGAFKGDSAPKGSRAADFDSHSRDGKRKKPSAFHGFNQGSGKGVLLSRVKASPKDARRRVKERRSATVKLLPKMRL
jgi:hypothetical protein